MGLLLLKLATDMFCCHIPPLRVRILLAMILYGGYYGDVVAKLHKQTNKQTNKKPPERHRRFQALVSVFLTDHELLLVEQIL